MSTSKVRWNGTTEDGRTTSVQWGNNSFTWSDVALAIEVADVVKKAGSSYKRRKENLEKQQAKIQEKRELEEERGGKGRFLTLEENRQAQLNEMEQKKTMETTTTAPVIINNDSSIRSNSSNTQSVNETITSRDGMLISAVSDF